MRVETGKTVIAKGEISVKGEFEILGFTNSSLRINAERYIPIYCITECEVEIRGDYTVVDGSTIPESWRKLAEMDWETLFIYGGVDCGKSTLATYLINRCGGYVLDLDIGQSDIAHPGAMGYGYSQGGIISLSEIKMINGFFTGCISPTGREARCLRGVHKLWSEIKKKEGRKIVDTTGWIRGRKAREYKLAKLEIIQPDLIASFNGKPGFLELYEVFEVERGFAIEKSREDRIKARKRHYSRWISDARVVELDISNIKTESTLFSGEIIPKEFIEDVIGKRVVFVRKGEDFMNICSEDYVKPDPGIIKALKELYDVEDLTVFSLKDLPGLLLGLYCGERYLGLGLLKDVESDKIRLITSADAKIDRVEFGEIRFDGEKEYIVRIP
jgi:polynucleotide 5'-hydroxyl-kinase GRC3/NOL9